MSVDHRQQTMQQENTRHTADNREVSFRLHQPSFLPVPSGLLQRKCACGGIPGLDGECAECRATRLGPQRQATNQAAVSSMPPIAHEVLRSPGQPLDATTRTYMEPRFGHDFGQVRVHADASLGLQASLTVNQPGDEYEQEADRVAEQVMRMSEPRLQRQAAAEEEEEEEEELLQTKRLLHRQVESGIETPSEAPAIVQDVLRSSGQPLDAATRAFMEPRFGHDFSRVRVHTDAQAAALARAVHARAFTMGRDVVFAAREYENGTKHGQQLLAHELTHVIQQSQGPTGNMIQRKPPLGGYKGTSTRVVKSAEFQEHPSQVYHGFDPTEPYVGKALMIPDGEKRRLAVRVRPSGAKPEYFLFHPNNFSVAEIADGIEVTCTSGLGELSEIMATDHYGNVLDRIVIRALPRKNLTVGYHFMHDPHYYTPIGTKRSQGEEKDLTDILNQVWGLQANIYFSIHSAKDPEEFKTVQGGGIGGTDVELSNLFSPFASGAQMEVFLVRELVSGSSTSGDANGRYLLGTNITILEDGDAHDGFDLSHEAGHFFGISHTDSGLMAPTIEDPDRPRVQSGLAGSANRRA